MECPKCSFDHADQTTECLRCGLIFEKYLSHQVLEHCTLPHPSTSESSAALPLERGERTCRLLALPLALLVAGLVVHSGLQPFLRIFLSMWVHELGHAVTAWLCGFGAFPGPWRTPVSSERVTAVTVVLALGLGWGMFRAWCSRNWYLLAGACFLLGCQVVCTLLPVAEANVFILFGGDAGCLVLGSLLMATFYSPRESLLYRDALRWGFLVIGAAAFMDAFSTWWGARSDIGRIPFGEMEGVGLSDPSMLTQEYGWTVQTLVSRYVWLGIASLTLLLIVYIVGVVRGRGKAVRK